MSKKLIAALLVLSIAVISQGEDKKTAKPKKKGVALKCPVSGKPAKKEFAVSYRKAKVYMCCPNCPKAFKATSPAHAMKANHQLVASGQAHQVKCPFAGRPVDKKTIIQVAGVKVGFCCNNCKGKAKAAKGDAQIKMIFAGKAFDKGFKVGKKKGKKKTKA